MTSKRAPRRRSAGPTCRKLAISVPEPLAKAVAGEVRAHRASSVSAFIAKAVEEKLERDRLQEALDEVWCNQPMTEEERQWADRMLQV